MSLYRAVAHFFGPAVEGQLSAAKGAGGFFQFAAHWMPPVREGAGVEAFGDLSRQFAVFLFGCHGLWC